MDPFQGLASLILGKLKESTLALWWKLLFQLAISAMGSFLITCGAVLTSYAIASLGSGKAFMSAAVWALAIGSGMTVSAVVIVVLIRKEQSKLLRGLTFVFPSAEASKELVTDLQTITKSNQEK